MPKYPVVQGLDEITCWIKFDGSPADVCVVDSWINRNPKEYKETDIDYDRQMLNIFSGGFCSVKRSIFQSGRKEDQILDMLGSGSLSVCNILNSIRPKV